MEPVNEEIIKHIDESINPKYEKLGHLNLSEEEAKNFKAKWK